MPEHCYGESKSGEFNLNDDNTRKLLKEMLSFLISISIGAKEPTDGYFDLMNLIINSDELEDNIGIIQETIKAFKLKQKSASLYYIPSTFVNEIIALEENIDSMYKEDALNIIEIIKAYDACFGKNTFNDIYSEAIHNAIKTSEIIKFRFETLTKYIITTNSAYIDSKTKNLIIRTGEHYNEYIIINCAAVKYRNRVFYIHECKNGNWYATRSDICVR